MSKNGVFILSLIILLYPLKSYASYEITEKCEMILVEILNLHIDNAYKQLQQEKVKFPENHYIDYLENYTEMVEVLVLEDIGSRILKFNPTKSTA